MQTLIPLAFFLAIGFSGGAVWSRLFGPEFGRNFGIPLSLSAFIIIGSPVLSSPLAPRWPIIMMLVAGGGWVLQVRWAQPGVWQRLTARPGMSSLVLVALIVGVVLFSSYADALFNVGPSNVDTAAHVSNTLRLAGSADGGEYPVGFYALLQPLSSLVSEGTLYRFGGPGLGVVVAFGIYLLARQFVSRGWAALAIVALSSSALGFFSVARSALFPTGLSLLLVPALIMATVTLADRESGEIGSFPGPQLALVGVLALALGLAVPVALFSVCFGMGLWLFAAVVAKRLSLRRAVLLLSFPTLGLTVWPLFQILRGGLEGPAGVASSGAGIISSVSVTLQNAIPVAPLEGGFSGSVGAIIGELFQVKEIRPPSESISSLGAWVLAVIAVVVIVVGRDRVGAPFQATAFFVIFYALAAQTGFSELATYRGRSAWYLPVFASLMVVFGAAEVEGKLPQLRSARLRVVAPSVALVLVAVALVLAPPTAVRPYPDEAFSGVLYLEARLDHEGELTVVSDIRDLAMIDGVGPVTPWANVEGCPAGVDAAVVLASAIDRREGILFESIVSGAEVSEAQINQRQALRDEASRLLAVEYRERLSGCGFTSVFSDGGVQIFALNPVP